MRTPVLNLAGSINTVPSTSAARYAPFAGGAALSTWHGQASSECPFPVAGKLVTWVVEIDVAPGSGKSWLAEMMIGGVADPNFKITIADAATVGSVTVDAAVAAQAIGVIRLTPSGTPAAIAVVKSGFVFEGTDPTHSVIFGGVGGSVNMSNTVSQYFAPGSLDFHTTRLRSMGVVSAPGTFSALTVYANTAVLTGSYAFKVWHSTAASNGAAWTDTGITCSLSSGRLAFDSTHNYHFARGDLIQLEQVPTGTPTGIEIRWSMCFIPDTPGESLLFSLMTDQVNSSGDTLFHANGASARTSGVPESQVQNIMPCAAVWRNLVTRDTTAPGSGKSRSSTLRVNAADTAVTCSIADTNVSANDTTHSVALVAFDKLSIKTTASANFPTAPGQKQWGSTLFIDPSAGGGSSFVPRLGLMGAG